MSRYNKLSLIIISKNKCLFKIDMNLKKGKICQTKFYNLISKN